MYNIAVFVSGSGTNCENLIRHFAAGDLARVSVVVSNRADAFALTRASRLGVEGVVMPKSEMMKVDPLLGVLESRHIDFIVLAGFLPLVPDRIVELYERRIVNIHPALLPKFGGKGMWGHHVHEAVCAAHETETGITVHFVSTVCDGGEIIFQAKTPVLPGDTPDDVAAKVHVLEQRWFPEIVEKEIRKLKIKS